MSKKLPQVALIGRPNVGKSTLFNRLIKARVAIVQDRPGVTRDRQYGKSEWNGVEFEVVDTGGFEPKTDDVIFAAMRKQSEMAIEASDVVIFLADGREGILPQDKEIFNNLRRRQKPFLVAINKLDNLEMEALIVDFYALGINELYPISSLHGAGVGDLLDEVVMQLKEIEAQKESEERAKAKDEAEGDDLDDEDSEEWSEIALDDEGEEGEGGDAPWRIPRIAVVGKPNVGKSTIINRIVGEERLLALPIAGTTRDAVDVELNYNDQSYLFIDTAGLRRKKYIKRFLEKAMIEQAVDALGRCDIALLLIDATEGVSEQDAKIAGIAHNRGRPVIILVNKWDLVKRSPKAMKEFEEGLRYHLKYLHYAPVLFCSAKTGMNIDKIFRTIDNTYVNYRRRVTTGELNRFFAEMMQYHPPPVHKGRPIKFYYITQARIAPPTFMISANQPNAAHVTYQRFIINSIRGEFGFDGVPIKLKFRRHNEKKEMH